MAAINPFTPNTAGTVSIAVTASSAATALRQGGQNMSVFVQSLAGNAILYVDFGPSTVTTTILNGTPILPGNRYCFTLPSTATHIAVIGTAGTLYVTSGQGVSP